MRLRVFSLYVRLTPLSDTILPPVSSKVLKNMIEKGVILSSMKPLIESRAKLKPIFISNLGISENKRLFSTGNKELVVKAGKTLYGRIGAVFDGNMENVFSDTSEIETPYGKFRYEIDRLEFTEIGSKLNISKDSNIKITFMTPTLLSSKMYLPPSLADKYKEIDVGFSLLPTPGLIAAAAYRTYYGAIGNANKPEVNTRAFKLNVLVNSFTRVINYELKPVTIVLGNDEKGNLRKSRGVIGWIEFDIVHDKFRDALLKYLNVARFLGIGRSRGIGLGEISIVGTRKIQSS
ncbi:MAG: CRISPR system precrRNA processing endoribonuclease RAMP protein Cas6 [Sulfolobus sp.]|nr:CRISPR system precrRNA processing endoribonuclease RAMP protein Cas6 [Sulfolobus sp.]